jgi:O-antigen/teichoic acid export membrane protein
LEQGHRISIALISGQVLYVGLLLLIVRTPEDIIYVPLAQLVGEIGTGLLLLIPFFQFGEIKLDLRKGLKILKRSGFWTVSRLLRALIYTFDVVLIGLILSQRDLGLYTAPYRICMLLVALAVTVHSLYLPVIAHAFTESFERGRLTAEYSLHLASAIAAPMVVGGAIIAEPLLLTVFGSDYIEGAEAFRLLLISTGFVFLHGANHNLLMVLNRTKVEMLVFTIAATVNVGLNLIFIFRYSLVIAASITALTEILTLVMGVLVLYKNGIRLKLFKTVVRPLAAALAMGIVLIALGSGQMLIMYLGVGGACYILFLILCKGVPQDMQLYLQTLAVFANELRVKFLKR